MASGVCPVEEAWAWAWVSLALGGRPAWVGVLCQPPASPAAGSSPDPAASRADQGHRRPQVDDLRMTEHQKRGLEAPGLQSGVSYPWGSLRQPA